MVHEPLNLYGAVDLPPNDTFHSTIIIYLSPSAITSEFEGISRGAQNISLSIVELFSELWKAIVRQLRFTSRIEYHDVERDTYHRRTSSLARH